jgi:hypothetical protein
MKYAREEKKIREQARKRKTRKKYLRTWPLGTEFGICSHEI